MKTLGRIFIILAVTALVAGALYLIFNGNSAGISSDFRPQGEAGFQPGGARPDFEGGRPDRDGMAGGWIFGTLKNLVVVSVLVAVIVLPKSLGKRKRLASVKADSREVG